MLHLHSHSPNLPESSTSVECLEKAFKAKRLNKNLQSNIGDEVYDRLRDEITNG